MDISQFLLSLSTNIVSRIDSISALIFSGAALIISAKAFGMDVRSRQIDLTNRTYEALASLQGQLNTGEYDESKIGDVRAFSRLYLQHLDRFAYLIKMKELPQREAEYFKDVIIISELYEKYISSEAHMYNNLRWLREKLLNVPWHKRIWRNLQVFLESIIRKR